MNTMSDRRPTEHDGECCPCVPGLQQHAEELLRHADRLHRRIEQGTDYASLRGEVQNAAKKYHALERKVARHLSGDCNRAVHKANAKLDALVDVVGKDVAIPVFDAFEEEWRSATGTETAVGA